MVVLMISPRLVVAAVFTLEVCTLRVLQLSGLATVDMMHVLKLILHRWLLVGTTEIIFESVGDVTMSLC